VPFLDYRLVEFCYGLPNELKIKHGLGKHVMREAMRGILNEKVRMRKEKVGFNAPFDKWLKHELKEDVDRLLQDPRARIYAFIDQLVLLDYWREHLRGTYNHMMLFWTVLNLEYWLCYVEEKGKTRAAFD
jgi:asparagine synthase (glutamine-hydrolysing)